MAAAYNAFMQHALLNRSQDSIREQYLNDGYCTSQRLLPASLITQACSRMDAVISGEYATGVAPLRSPVSGPSALHKIDQVHLTDPLLRAVCTHPAIGALAAEITGAQRIQLWAVQMLFKPAQGDESGGIGFHQDRWYWPYWSEDSEVFTAWVALSDIANESGPMCVVPRSHTWGALSQNPIGAFTGGPVLHAAELPGIPMGAEVAEVPLLLAAGAVSFHHRLMLHGSGVNSSPHPRRALALHLRTERSRPVAGASDYYVSHLEDPAYCPVIFDRTEGPNHGDCATHGAL